MTGSAKRTSLRAALVAKIFSLLPVKRLFNDPAAFRKAIDRQGRKTPSMPGRSLKRQAEITLHGDPRYPLVRLVPRGRSAGRNIFYLHGGAHAFEINRLHWRFIGQLMKETGCSVSVPIFPLVPHATGREIFTSVSEAWQLARSLSPAERLCAMGDSAGAGLAMALAIALAKEKADVPDLLVLLSPWLDLELADPALVASDHSDPVLGLPGLGVAARLFADDRPLADPEISPLNADLDHLPPTLIITGGRDLLASDARRLFTRSSASQRQVTLLDVPDMIHNWMLLPIPENRQALDAITRFLAGGTQECSANLRSFASAI